MPATPCRAPSVMFTMAHAAQGLWLEAGQGTSRAYVRMTGCFSLPPALSALSQSVQRVARIFYKYTSARYGV